MIDRILVNREECEVRVAFLEQEMLVELHTEKFDEQTIVNNIYRGKVQDVVPGLQAAFVDCGLGRNMFLHFMDIRPESLVLSAKDQMDAMRVASENPLPGRIERKGRRPRQDPSKPQAESPVKKGDDIIVQVVKDEIGGKAPRVTTNLSLAGRYLVLLPFPSQDGGVSRKIAMGQDRYRLKKLLSSLRSSSHSFIVRTAGLGQPEEAIAKDGEALEHLWVSILERYKALGKPGLINNDRNLLARLVRDAFPAEFKEVICDHADDAGEIHQQLLEHMPGSEGRVRNWQGTENIFEAFDVEKQIEKAMNRKVWLKSGGSLIIDENEALTAIDVNTGRFTGRKEQEKTSLKTNMEACEAIAQQIRLRDIGGIIVIDFIDMMSRAHQERVSEELRRHLKNDRAKSALGKIGDFGLMMLTRKRQRMSLQNQIFDDCPYCKGTGLVLQPDEIFRKLKYDLRRLFDEEDSLGGILVTVHPNFLGELTSRFGKALEGLAQDCEIFYKANPEFHLEDYQITPVRKPEGAITQLPGARIDSSSRVLPIIEPDDISLAGAIPVRPVEPASEPAPPEAAPEKAVEPASRRPASPTRPPREEKDEKEATGSRNRRRRSSRRGSGETGAQEPAKAAPADSVPGEVSAAADSPATPAESPSEEEENRRRRRRESSAERRARRRRAKERRDDDDAPESTAAAAEVVELPPAPAKEREEASEPAKLIPAGPLKLKTVSRSPVDDLVAGLLEEIEKEAETMKDAEPPAEEPKQEAPARRPRRKTTAKAKPAGEQAPAEVQPEAEEKEPAKKTTRRRTTAAKTTAAKTTTRKTTAKKAAKEADPAEAPAEEKPRKATTRRRTTAKATTKAAPEKDEQAPKKAATTRKTTAKTTKSAGEAAPKEEKAPAAKKTTRKTTTRRKPAAEKKD